MPPGGDGFRIPVVLDFQQSINNITDFRRAVARAFTDIGERSRSAQNAGAPLSAKALTGAIGRQAGAAQAAVNRAVDLSPEQREQLRGYIDRQVDAQVAAFRRDPAYRDLKAPTDKQISRSRVAEERRIDAARAREAQAAERAAAAGEKIAADTTRRAARTATGGLPPTTPKFAEAFGREGIPSEAELEERLRLLRAQQTANPNAFQRAGRQAGIDRLAGLQFGLGEERDELFAGAEAQALRLELTIARRIRELDERSDVEEALIGQERALLRKTAELNVLMERRQLEQRGDQRDIASTDLDELRAADRLGRERDRARVTDVVAGATTPDIASELGRSRAADKTRRARIDTVANREIVAREQNVKALAEEALSTRARTRAINAAANAQLRAQGQQGTFIQRAQAYIAQRSGGPPREATDYLTGRQLFASRALTTASFAASGALLYGGVQFAKELVKEATALQIELGIVNSQLREAGDVGGASFARIRQEIIGVSKDTGVMANQVALVVRQLAGAFASPEGVPDFGRAIEEARSAFQLGRVTGLPDQEITDSLTAISLAFEKTGEDGEAIRVPFEQIGDTIIGLEQRFGVLAPEIVKFTADLAPLGAELGFTVTQLSALGAVAQQVSGRTGAVLSEQFGRILPALADRSADLLLLFQQNEKTAQQIPVLSRALAQRDLPAVLEQLVAGYDNFTAAQRNTLVSLVGSRREAGAFYAILARGEQTRRALNTTPDEFTGQQGRRFEDFSKTVEFSFDRAQRAIEQFGITLFNAGLADLLAGAGKAAELFFATLNGILQPLLALNEATDGWVTKLAALALGLFLVNKALLAMAAIQKSLAASKFLDALSRPVRAPIAGPPTPPGMTGFGPQPGRLPIGTTLNPFGGSGINTAGPGAVSGFLNANGPGLLLLAGVIGKTIRDQGVKDLSEGVDFLRQQVREALAKGMDPAEIRRIAQQGQDDLGTFDKLNLFIHGQPNLTNVADEETNNFYAELRKRQLAAIRDQQEAAVKEAGEFQPDYSKYKGGSAANFEADQRRDFEANHGITAEMNRVTQDFIDRFAEDPNGLAKQAQAYIDAVDDPALRRILTDLQEKFVTDMKDVNRRQRELNAAADRLGSATGQVSLDELRSAVSSGSKGPDELIARLEQQVADVETVTAQLRAAQNEAAPAGATADELEKWNESQAEMGKQLQGFVDQRQALLDEIKKLAEERFTAPADLRIRIRESLNLPTADEENLAEIKSVITQLEGINPEEQLERVFQGIELLRSMAEAAGEKTFKIPPEFLAIIAKAQVPAAVQGAEGEAIARILNIGVDALADRIVTAITEVGLDGQKISAAIIAARRAMLIRARAAAADIVNFRVRESRLKGIGEDLSDLDALESEMRDLVVSLLGGIETGGSTGFTDPKPVDPKILARAIAEGNLAIRRARANGDPVQLARLAIEAADIQARFAKDKGEELQAMAARIEAINQLRDADADIGTALSELAQAQSANDAVLQTQFAANAAAGAVSTARGTAARIRAQAAQVSADRAARDAIRDVYTAHQELLIAIANAAGDTVEAATLQLAVARQNLQNLMSEGGGDAEIDRAKAEVVNAAAAARDAKFQDQMGDIDFLLDMERISIQQAIRMLEAMMRIPENTEEMTRSIERRIKGLRDELGRDFQFNLPSNLDLPTLYEVRRLSQTQQGAGYNAAALANQQASTLGEMARAQYNDNRVISLEFNANNVTEAEDIMNKIIDSFSRPSRFGTNPGIF